MSKFLKVLIVMLTIAAFAAPVMAADNFSVSGNMFVYGIYNDNDAADGATTTTAQQKLRVYGIFKANDMVSVQFRTDFQEGNWGTDNGAGRSFLDTAGSGKTIRDFDRAFIDIKLDKVDLRAGTQFVGFGKSGSLVYNDTGITTVIKGEMPITLTYSLFDDTTATENFFAGNVKVGAFNIFAGNENDQTKSVTMLGASYQAKYDAINVVAEANYFMGDHTAAVDAIGMQAFVDASMAVSDTLSAGGAVYYAAGTKKTDEQVYTVMGASFGNWDAFTRGPFADESYSFSTRPYEALGSQAGIIAVQGYADMKVSDSLNGGASLVYAMAEEDTVATADSMILLSVFATYKLADNVAFNNGIQYVSYDKDNATSGESSISAMSGLNVSF